MSQEAWSQRQFLHGLRSSRRALLFAQCGADPQNKGSRQQRSSADDSFSRCCCAKSAFPSFLRCEQMYSFVQACRHKLVSVQCAADIPGRIQKQIKRTNLGCVYRIGEGPIFDCMRLMHVFCRGVYLSQLGTSFARCGGVVTGSQICPFSASDTFCFWRAI